MIMNPLIIEQVLELAIKVQQIPAPTFQEGLRADFVRKYFYNLGVRDVFSDDPGNVYACIKGQGRKPPIVVSAHLDTVFPANTILTTSRKSEKIFGPGIGDNATGLAGLFGLYLAIKACGEELQDQPCLEGDLWLIANVGEEGLGDLKGMKEIVTRFGKNVLAYIVLEGMAFGQIYHRGLGVRRYRIGVHTRGGHSWIDYGSPSAIHEIADLLVKIKNIKLSVEPRTSLNIGLIAGGTSVNTIAADASFELDLRSESTEGLSKLIQEVEVIVEEAGKKDCENVRVYAEIIGNRPAGEISADHPLVKLARNCYERNGIRVKLNIGSTDANQPLSLGLPAICVGLTTGGRAHTSGEYIDLKPIGKGLEILTEVVIEIFRNGLAAY